MHGNAFVSFEMWVTHAHIPHSVPNCDFVSYPVPEVETSISMSRGPPCTNPNKTTSEGPSVEALQFPDPRAYFATLCRTDVIGRGLFLKT